MYRSTLHSNCTAEYTLAAMLAGTYSVLAAVLQGAISAVPKAFMPMLVRLLGRMMLVILLQL